MTLYRRLSLLAVTAVLAISALAETGSRWYGSIHIGNRVQYYSGKPHEQVDNCVEISMISTNNQELVITIDEDGFHSPNHPVFFLSYNLTTSQGEPELEVEQDIPAGGFLTYSLFSQTFHQLLNSVVSSGKSVNVFLVNPISPSLSQNFLLSPYGRTVTAIPVSPGGVIQSNNGMTFFQQGSPLNWNYYMSATQTTQNIQQMFSIYHFFPESTPLVNAFGGGHA